MGLLLVARFAPFRTKQKVRAGFADVQRFGMQSVWQLFSHINADDSDKSRKRNMDLKSDYNNGAGK